MKNLFSILTALFAVLAFFISCSGSGSIYGVVSDKATGEPIKNAGVELMPVGLKTVTGSDGYFDFPDVLQGKYNLFVTKTGYSETKSKDITVKSGKNSPQDVQLEKKTALRIVDDAGNDISELDFGGEINDVSRQFNIFNDGLETLEWEISFSTEWIKSFSKESGELKAEGIKGIIVNIDRSRLESGENVTTIHVTSDNGNKQLTIKVETNSRIRECTDLPENAEWNNFAEIKQTWDGKEWIPPTTGSYNEISNEMECRFKCKKDYTWENSKCISSRTANCENLPNGASWTTPESVEQTWNGSEWVPSNQGVYDNGENSDVCKFQCNTNYTWNGSKCVANTQMANCAGLPENASWNTASSITQTWNGSSWQPSPTGTYNTTASTTECRYKCNTNYNWSSSTSKCIAATQQENCSPKPANTVWNTVSTVTQTWSGSAWSPSNTSIYNTTPSTSECRYKCVNGYHTENNGASCISNTKTGVACTGLPANASWNTASSITQTWNGSSWQPTSIGSYNTVSSNNECRYKCDDTHYWYDSECSSPCDYEPCQDVSNSTKICSASAWNEYFCECNMGYTWNRKKCLKRAFGNICTGQTQCYNASTTVICPISSTADFFGQDSQYAALGHCIFKDFIIDSSVASEKTVIDNNTGLEWQQKISGSTYTWQNANTYCNNLAYGGHNDWRLPSPKELMTITDLSKSSPAIDSKYFPNTPTDGKFANSAYNSRTVNIIENCHGSGMTVVCSSHDYELLTEGFTAFNNGVNQSQNCGYNIACTLTFYARCVRGNALEQGNFISSTINNDTIVTDLTTSLIWQQDFVSDKTWQAALKYCEDLTYAGYSDWRLPNRNELASLINLSADSATSSFPDMPAATTYFWSSSSDQLNNNFAWRVHLHSFTFSDTIDKTTTHSVRCVRSAQ